MVHLASSLVNQGVEWIGSGGSTSWVASVRGGNALVCDRNRSGHLALLVTKYIDCDVEPCSNSVQVGSGFLSAQVLHIFFVLSL